MTNQYIISEDDFLALIAATVPNTHPSLILGRGDDCAEVACPPQLAVSTDLFVEDVHFRQRYFTPEEIGYKAMAVNISDMAAAGAQPLGVSVGLVAPVPFPRDRARGIIEGMATAARRYNLALAGGDLSRGEKLVLCVTIWGAPAPGRPDDATPRFLRRGPVAPGDVLFLCGRAGLARAGLALLEERGRKALADYPVACEALLEPTPLVDAGLALAALPDCRLMDVSDGLLRDLPRLLGAYGMRCGAAATLPEASLHPEVASYARGIGEHPPLFAFRGGEDFSLLGACSPETFPLAVAALKANAPGVPVLRLGAVTEDPVITLNGRCLTDEGFDHFSRT